MGDQQTTTRTPAQEQTHKSEGPTRPDNLAVLEEEENVFPGAVAVTGRGTTSVLRESRSDVGSIFSSQHGIEKRAHDEEQLVIAQLVTDETIKHEEDLGRKILQQRIEKRALESQVRKKILRHAVKAEVIAVDSDTTATTSHQDPSSIAENLRPTKIKEQLFGDARSCNVDVASTPRVIRTRSPLPWSVYRNETTKMWITSNQTSQSDRTDQSCVKYSFASKTQASRIGRQMAPPLLHPFSENPNCHVCKSKFAVFRRPHNCRNCGVCVCSYCSTSWPSKMVPETFNMNNESSVTVCSACDWLSTSFQSALTKGQKDKAMRLYKTGNINLSTPFANIKGNEVLYPIHCAVLGGNLDLLKWLVDEHFCPLQVIPRQGRGKNTKEGPILSSKGRSALSIALEKKRVDFIRYLVSTKGMSLSSEKNLDVAAVLVNFTTVLDLLPEKIANATEEESDCDSKGYI